MAGWSTVIGGTRRLLFSFTVVAALTVPAAPSAGAKPQGEQRVTELVSKYGPGYPVYTGASPDLTRVYFQTMQSLVPGDADEGLNDVYVARATGPGCPAAQKGSLQSKCQGGR